ncbi:MAG: hypothetical protein IKC97_06890 [Clostridia bacterium]|nr:hypothetical protein [Clostridia bacterium]
MKRIKLLLCILVVTLLCCGCGFFSPQEYICETDDVKSIQIVRLDKYVEGEYRYEYTVLCEIKDTSVFVERLNNLECKVNWGDPKQMNTEYVVIKIDYLNGDYDLLYPNAQLFHRSDSNNYGYFFFDEEQFNALISDYTAE